ncbi:hypothetical protein DFH09DRAFT_1186807, partial [Mycena vulgaris]
INRLTSLALNLSNVASRCRTVWIYPFCLPRPSPPPPAAVCSPCRRCSTNPRYIQPDYLRTSPSALVLCASPSSGAPPQGLALLHGLVQPPRMTVGSKYHPLEVRQSPARRRPSSLPHIRRAQERPPLRPLANPPRTSQVPRQHQRKHPPPRPLVRRLPVPSTKRVRSLYPSSPRPRLVPSSCARPRAHHRVRVLALTH